MKKTVSRSSYLHVMFLNICFLMLNFIFQVFHLRLHTLHSFFSHKRSFGCCKEFCSLLTWNNAHILGYGFLSFATSDVSLITLELVQVTTYLRISFWRSNLAIHDFWLVVQSLYACLHNVLCLYVSYDRATSSADKIVSLSLSDRAKTVDIQNYEACFWFFSGFSSGLLGGVNRTAWALFMSTTNNFISEVGKMDLVVRNNL